ncbi:DNA-binding transcriptional regulator, MarR family [Tranquillimonas rosea]|uniref:DNA-binding transcriptional regulator, MarR family n=1 Tax=Tranquillimonas rosea TaxID=641238 RepID=A0A1H9WX20_9RHOB|nr:MarR family transcriptional regulator [Tranquillimonas rosea]SES38369.1 DNA-binding transcriptional regulator, MarR family [Tranquillimonas rosea]
MQDPPSYSLHDSLGYRLSLAARLQERRLDDGLRQLGLSRTTWCLLLGVGSEGLRHPSDLAQFVGIDRTATSRALRQLEAAGLIARKPGVGDRRTTEVSLTDQGREALVRGVPMAEANNAAMAAKLSADELDTLHRLLSRLTRGEATALERI